MKKIIYLIVLILTSSCSKEEDLINLINLKLDLNLVEEYLDDYEFSDFKIKVYETKANYLNEINPVFSGQFSDDGTISITENLSDKSYFVDIFTEDNKLGNWVVTDLNVDHSNTVKFYAGGFRESDIDRFTSTYIYDYRSSIGEWDFYNYIGSVLGNTVDRVTKKTLTIYKDFTVESEETYNDKDFTLIYELDNMFTSHYLSSYIKAEPNLIGYRDGALRDESLQITINSSGILTFNDYSFETNEYIKTND